MHAHASSLMTAFMAHCQLEQWGIGSAAHAHVMGTADSTPISRGKVSSSRRRQISGLCCNHLAEKPATPISITAEPAHLATAAGDTNYKCTL